MLFQYVLLGMELPKPKIIFPHKQQRLGLLRVKWDVFQRNVLYPSRVDQFFFTVVENHNEGALRADQQASYSLFSSVNAQLFDSSFHPSAHSPDSIFIRFQGNDGGELIMTVTRLSQVQLNRDSVGQV